MLFGCASPLSSLKDKTKKIKIKIVLLVPELLVKRNAVFF